MQDILLRHTVLHPSMTAQDMIKLCYQAVYGAEHLLTERSRAWAYFRREWEATPGADRAMVEQLSDAYCRIDLAAWKYANLPADWLFRMFYASASTPATAPTQALSDYFDTVGKLARDGRLPFDTDTWYTTLTEYERQGGGPVHHSAAYREAECPAYRVVSRQYADLIPLLTRLASLPHTADAPKIIAIDGRATSGKSTLAKRLAPLLEADVIHMDDFFLPPALRTAERLSEAGGNIHYERFAEEVLCQLKHNGSFTYEAFSCQTMTLDQKISIASPHWRIVEGAYSHHPYFADYMDFRIFCHVPPQEQMRRILLRNGENMARRFAEVWIPMEEHYFSSYPIEKRADYQITN